MSAPAVLMLDDGELDDIQEMLLEMEIPFARIRGGAIVAGTEPPRDVLIATPRRIDAVRAAGGGDGVDGPIRVMVVNEDSNALRAQLRRDGFDYLVRRPVHAEALRLMLLHCCYKGEDRRREPRVAVGVEVAFRTALVSRTATLVDLSSRGCRLLSQHRVERGKRITVQIQEALDAGDRLPVPARVIHVEDADVGGRDAFWLGVAFEKLDEATQNALALIIEDRAQGPATLRTSALDAPPGAGAPAPPPAASSGHAQPTTTAAADRMRASDRRKGRRAAYSQTIPAFGERALRVLVGRDLSLSGMRVEHSSDLWLGDRLQLAIYGDAGDEPMLVWGTVERSDARTGLMIRFDPLERSVEVRLERLVASLPAVESLHDSEAEAMGTVVGEILLTEAAAR